MDFSIVALRVGLGLRWLNVGNYYVKVRPLKKPKKTVI